MKRVFSLVLVLAVAGHTLSIHAESMSKDAEVDVVVYGGTASGVIAAVAAAREGK